MWRRRIQIQLGGSFLTPELQPTTLKVSMGQNLFQHIPSMFLFDHRHRSATTGLMSLQRSFQKLTVQTATVEARQLRVQLGRCPVSKVAVWQHCKKILSDRPTETYKYACLEGLVCVHRRITQKVTNASQYALVN